MGCPTPLVISVFLSKSAKCTSYGQAVDNGVCDTCSLKLADDVSPRAELIPTVLHQLRTILQADSERDAANLGTPAYFTNTIIRKALATLAGFRAIFAQNVSLNAESCTYALRRPRQCRSSSSEGELLDNNPAQAPTAPDLPSTESPEVTTSTATPRSTRVSIRDALTSRTGEHSSVSVLRSRKVQARSSTASVRSVTRQDCLLFIILAAMLSSS